MRPNEPRPWARALRNLCLKKLNDFGGKGTARQIADNIGRDIQLISPRLTELAQLGAIRDSGERTSWSRGRPLIVWEVVDLADCDQARDGHSVTGQKAQKFATAFNDDAPAWFGRYGH